MPYRPKTPCHHPGCPELVEAGRLYCEKHSPSRGDPPGSEAWIQQAVAESQKVVSGSSSTLCAVCQAGQVRPGNGCGPYHSTPW